MMLNQDDPESLLGGGLLLGNSGTDLPTGRGNRFNNCSSSGDSDIRGGETLGIVCAP